MISLEHKPLRELLGMVAPYGRVLVLGCSHCGRHVERAGGPELAAAVTIRLREAGCRALFSECFADRQCRPEALRPLAARLRESEAVLSVGCGVGVQAVAGAFPMLRVLPAMNTLCDEQTDEHRWSEQCLGCGDCRLGDYGAVCPKSRCTKGLLNGPCGGSMDGRCEADPAWIECAWSLIQQCLEAQGRLEQLGALTPPRSWFTVVPSTRESWWEEHPDMPASEER